MRDVRFGKGALQGGRRRRVIDHSVADGGCDLVVRGVGEADVQDRTGVVTGHIHGAIDGLEYVLLHQFALTQNTDARTVAVEQVAVLRELGEFDFCHIHEGIHFVFGPLEVFNAKGVDGDDFDAGLVADLKDLASSRFSIYIQNFGDGVLFTAGKR